MIQLLIKEIDSDECDSELDENKIIREIKKELKKEVNKIMATMREKYDELNIKLDDFSQTISDEIDEVASDVQALRDALGEPDVDLQPLIDKVDAGITRVKSISDAFVEEQAPEEPTEETPVV